MVYREQLVIALVLKDLGIELPNKLLAEKVAAALVLVDALTERSERPDSFKSTGQVERDS